MWLLKAKASFSLRVGIYGNSLCIAVLLVPPVLGTSQSTAEKASAGSECHVYSYGKAESFVWRRTHACPGLAWPALSFSFKQLLSFAHSSRYQFSTVQSNRAHLGLWNGIDLPFPRRAPLPVAPNPTASSASPRMESWAAWLLPPRPASLISQDTKAGLPSHCFAFRCSHPGLSCLALRSQLRGKNVVTSPSHTKTRP